MTSTSLVTTTPLIPITILLLLILPGLFYLAPHILPPPRSPPISFPDELQDLTLFRRAATPDPRINSHLGSTNAKPKIAFLFLTNSDLHFAPLWEIFFNGSSSRSLFNVYVHADPTVLPKVNIPGGVFTKDRFITAKKTFRGTATLIAAARRLLAAAILGDPLNQYFTLVSQQCIPLHSFGYFYNALFEADKHQDTEMRLLFKYKSFIEIVSKVPYLSDRYNARGKNVMLPEVTFEKFKMGSQFWTLTRRHALVVVADRKLWKKFRMHCLRPQSCYPEEHYFPTLLSMKDPDGCTSYTLTNVNWTDTVNGHPWTYHPNEVSPGLIHELRQSNFTNSYMFARKFSPDCLEPLMKIAHEVIFRD